MKRLKAAPGGQPDDLFAPNPNPNPAIHVPFDVNAACGLYVGDPEWRHGSDWVYEPGECQWEGVIQVEQDDWENGHANTRCPKCGGELDQSMGHFEELEEQ